MKTPKINTNKLAAALAPIALTGAVLAPAAAASPSSHSPVAAATRSNVGLSDGVHLYNSSSHQIKLINVTGNGHFEGRPPDGTVLNPGDMADFEVQWHVFDDENDTMHFAILENGSQIGTFDADVHDPNRVEGSPFHMGCSTSIGQCTPTDWSSRDWSNKPSIVLYDPPNNNLGPDQKQRQAEVLNLLCEKKVAGCSFTPTSEKPSLGDAVRAGEVSTNRDADDFDAWITASDTRGESDSVGVDVTGGVEKIVVAEVTVKYDHEWEHSHEFSQEEKVKVPAHTSLWFCHTAPMLRDTGDFTVTLGSTTWNLTDVYFDHPDNTGDGLAGDYYIAKEPYPNPVPPGSCTGSNAAHDIQWTPLS